MSLLLLAGVAGAGIMYVLNKKDHEYRELAKGVAEVKKQAADSGRWDNHSKITGLAHSGQVTASYPDRDLRGVPCMQVAYGGHTFHRVYAPPNITGAQAQNY